MPRYETEMLITVEMLSAKNACQEQVDLFEATFGAAVEVTQDNCIKAAKVLLDFDWAADNLLNRKQREFYMESEAPLWTAYEEAQAPLLAAYKEAEAPLWAAYKAAEAIAFYNATKRCYDLVIEMSNGVVPNVQIEGLADTALNKGDEP